MLQSLARITSKIEFSTAMPRVRNACFYVLLCTGLKSLEVVAAYIPQNRACFIVGEALKGQQTVGFQKHLRTAS